MNAVLRYVMALLICLSQTEASPILIGGGHTPLSNEAALEDVFIQYVTGLNQLSGDTTIQLYANGSGHNYSVRNHNSRWISDKTNPLSLLFYSEDLLPGTFRSSLLASAEPASKTNIMTTTGKALDAAEPEDQLVIIFSGHGRKSARAGNNSIRLWNDEFFTTKDFRKTVAFETLKSGITFVASQCYSGSFHDVAIESVSKNPNVTAPICGFTAVPRWDLTEECTATVQTDGYQEYGITLLEEALSHSNRSDTVNDINKNKEPSLYESHLSVLSRMHNRMDIPLSSSEAFLLSSEHWYERWSLQRKYSEENPYLKVAQAMPSTIDEPPGSMAYFQELSRRLKDAANQQASAAQIEYDNMDEAVLLRQAILKDLISVWPQLTAPFSPAANQLLIEQGDAITLWVASHPDIDQLYNYEIRSKELSENWIDATRRLAALRRLHQTWQLAGRYERVMAKSNERRQQYRALRRCEDRSPW